MDLHGGVRMAFRSLWICDTGGETVENGAEGIKKMEKIKGILPLYPIEIAKDCARKSSARFGSRFKRVVGFYDTKRTLNIRTMYSSLACCVDGCDGQTRRRIGKAVQWIHFAF